MHSNFATESINLEFQSPKLRNIFPKVMVTIPSDSSYVSGKIN